MADVVDRYLLVPMNIEALLVGSDAGATTSWSNLTPRFADVRNKRLYLGIDLITLLSGPADATWAPKRGIHLHWALPEALARASAHGASESGYPPIPNRWLVQRFVESANGAVAVRGWIVESDAIDAPIVAGQEPAVSYLDLTAPGFARRFGASRLLNLGETYQPMPAPARIPLTALGWGHPAFATYYPACKGVLGFHDPQPPDLAAGERLGYLVVGWFSDPENDPLRRPLSSDSTSGAESPMDPLAEWQTRLSELNWSCAGVPKSGADAPANRTMCHGAVVNIAWTGRASPSTVPDPADYRVAVGNSSVEALASLLRPDGSNTIAAEALLQGLQHGILARETDPTRVHDELHVRRFGAVDGGVGFAIQERRAAKVGDASLLLEVPDALVAWLESLNALVESAARTRRELAAARQQLYCSWCLWARDYLQRRGPEPSTRQPRLDLTTTLSRLIETLSADRQRLEADVASGRLALARRLADGCPDLELVDATLAPFYQANEPTVVISGNGLGRTSRWRPPAEDAALVCRLPEGLVDRLLVDIPNNQPRNAVLARDLFAPIRREASIGNPLGRLVDGLLLETMLLEDANAERIARQAYAVAGIAAPAVSQMEGLPIDIRAYLDAVLGRPGGGVVPKYTRLADGAIAPDPASQSAWRHNPWLPCLLQWEVEWRSEFSGVAESWSPTANWMLSDDQADLIPRAGVSMPSASNAPWRAGWRGTTSVYQGWTILNPDATARLRSSLQEAREGLTPDDAVTVDSLLDLIANPSVVSQSLGGFNDALLQLDNGLQLPPISPAFLVSNAGTAIDPIRSLLGLDPIQGLAEPVELCSPDALKTRFPVRAGAMTITKLWIVDGFGQTLKLGARSLTSPIRPALMLDVADDAAVDRLPMPPRLTQPARVRFDWEPAVPTAAGTAAASPVHGWIVPNHLDTSYLVYDAAGAILGALQKTQRIKGTSTGAAPNPSSRAFLWVPAPGDASPDALGFYLDLAAQDSAVRTSSPTGISDPTLAQFIGYLLGLEADAGSEFHAVVEGLLGRKDVGNPEDDPLLSILVGRPLALVTASIGFELAAVPGLDWQQGGVVADGFTKVAFPLRLGDAADPRDGLIGVFESRSQTGGAFYPAWGSLQTLGGRTYPGVIDHGREWAVNAGTRARVTFLVDAQRTILARTGILPALRVALPPRAISSVAGVKEAFFLTAPILGTSDTPRMPAPSDDYGQWSWAVRPDVTKWRQSPAIANADDRAAFGLSGQRLSEGWLSLRMNPVVILNFWVREGASTVPPSTNIRLAWKVQGADTVTLSREGIETPERTWDGASLTPEWEGPVLVERTTTFVLLAGDRRGNTSRKTVKVTVGSGNGNAT